LSILALTKKSRKTRLWQFDPSVFQPGPKAGFLERYIISNSRSLAKHTLYALAFAYQIVLVSLGVMFGGLVFWPSFAASMGLIWLVIKKTGYSHNFAGWDIGYKKFAGLGMAFGLYLGFVYGLAYTPLRLMTIPLMGGILVLALVIGVWKISNR